MSNYYVIPFFILLMTCVGESFWCISYLVAAVSLQSLWSLALAVVDIYALLVKRSLRNTSVVSLFAIGDGVRYSRRVNLITELHIARLLANMKA